ncbi:hypothetical protein ATO3_23300 [Marinibacterium profundimaris]|uniref:Uncharacterized protein n=1 Tax=Marinibacterium profundimaris TaxID=1679460 RepID=A0A225NCL7_9RHOB|nr:hypothetical protein ATO3_23300 [Marinibacterium profundimaris]
MTRTAQLPTALLLALGLGLAGCIEVPALDEAGDPALETADYPELIPLGPILAASTDPVTQAADLQADLQGRAARLQRQADALRGSDVLDPASRRRLQRGIEP